MTYGMTDIHQHLLWGVDDGPKTPEAMHSMLCEAHAQGITRVSATPHAVPGFVPFDVGLYSERLSEAQAFCRGNGLSVEVVPGAEIAWTYQTVSALRQHAVPTLAGSDCVLLELQRNISLQEAKTAVRALTRAGYCPVLAHVERCRCLCWSPREALRLRQETGAMYQVNADTLLQPGNLLERRFVRVMLQERAFDAVATDAHGTPARPVNLLAAHDWLLEHTDAAYARALTSFLGELK